MFRAILQAKRPRASTSEGANSATAAPPVLSLANVLTIVLPIAVIAGGAYWWSTGLESKAREEMSSNVFARILSANATMSSASMAYADTDGDLIADPPDDPAKRISPDVLMFSFVAGAVESVPADAWEKLLAQLAAKTGREVKYIHYGTTDEQLTALRNGEVHILGLNTGAVPLAVQRDGFVPICTFGREDGSYGYTMQVLVPADSPVKDIEGIIGRKVTFTRPDSNSGCKALLVLLREDYELLPDRDYSWGFSLGHEDSIKGVAAKEYEIAPVASDILARMVEKEDVDQSAIRTIYESERFPPATIGVAYNLAPELREAIRETLVGFDLRGTGVEGEYGANVTRLVPVNYKEDWETTREIDQLAAQARSARSS